MRFSEIVGHRAQLDSLKRALRGNRLHHAYLFLGPDGVGKRAVAYCLAAALHCPNGEDESCGRCGGCLCIRDGNHPDVHFIALEAGKKEISIRQIRELQKTLGYRPFTGKKKVAIIDQAHALNFHVQNSLLKTLEEPPGDSLLILIANSTGAILPTVLSRCLRLYFSHLPVAQVAGRLVQDRGMAPERARLLVALTKGSFGAALDGAAGELLDRRREWIESFTALSRDNLPAVLELAGLISGDKEKALGFLDWLEGWYRDILVHQATGSMGQIDNSDRVETIRAVAAQVEVENTLSVLCRIGQAQRELQRTYNRRLVLENFLIKIVTGDSPGP
ncbi:MAG: DNA polymerase III subunit delta' [Candidatus Binatia bacterium]|jgi:DNA polymerase-3 subunit delta'|nr:DNA polymerase III subunit delta' [Candidatus Binatia bacterium]